MRSRATVQSPRGYDLANLQAAQLLERMYPRTAAEIAAGVAPSLFSANIPWVDAVTRYGLVGDGATDNTDAFTAMLSVGGQALYIRQGTYLTGMMRPPSGTTLYLEPGTIIRDTGELVEEPGRADRFIDISSEDDEVSIDDVHIIGWGATIDVPRIAGYETGEQRHCLNIAGNVNNICVEGLTLTGSGGDGVHIGGVGGGLELTPDNVRLYGLTCDNNRRNAISITAGRSVTVDSCICAGANGTSPEKGIDMEPDQDGGGTMVGDMFDINIVNVRTVGNGGAGISYVNPYALAGKKVTVSVRDCVSSGDNSGFSLESAAGNGDAVVSFHNCKSFDAETNGFDLSNSGTRCLIEGCWVFNPNQSGQASDRFGSSYAIYSVNGTDGSTYGNVRIRNSYALGTTARKAVHVGLFSEPNSFMRDVDVEVWTDHAATKRASFALVAGQPIGKLRVKFTDETELATTASLSASAMTAYLGDVVSNAGAAGQVVLGLDDAISRLPGQRVTARVGAAQNLVVNASTGWTIGGGAALWSKTIGAQVTVEADPTASDGSTGKWRIVEGGDCWHLEPIVLDNTGSPSVANGKMFATGGTAALIDLVGGIQGQEITIMIKHDLTIDCTGTNLHGNGGADIAAKSGDWVQAVCIDGTNWRLAFFDCTA